MLIKVNGCEINGKKHGEQLEVNDKQAQYLISIGYATEVKVEAPKEKAPVKKPVKRATTTKKEK